MTSIKIPLQNNEIYDVTDLELECWIAAYPHIDVRAYLLQVVAWNISNPKRRKYRSGISRHINNWLKSENNKVMAGVSNGNATRLDVSTWTRKALGC